MPDLNPDWNQLPGNPLRFFGLEPAHERRDLKRAYGRLIRCFRPETHPNEFQRIRAAYEQLEALLRYDRDAGAGMLTPQSDRFQRNSWQPSEDGAANDAAFDTIVSDIDSVFLRLLDQPSPSPLDFYHLALLSDVVGSQVGERRKSFSDWLLLGLNAHPRDLSLRTLLSEYASRLVRVDSAASFVKRAARHLNDGQYYLVTEGLWFKLVELLSFEGFISLLDECESRLRLVNLDARDTFRVRLLKRLIWEAPREWVTEQINVIESQAASQSMEFHDELDFVNLLERLVFDPRLNADTHPTIDQIRRFLRAYCCADQRTETIKILRHANAIASDEHGLRAAFELLEPECQGAIASLTLMAFRDLRQHTRQEFATDQQEADGLSDAFIQDLWRTSLPNDLATIEQKYRIGTPVFWTLVWGIATALVAYWPVAMKPPAGRSGYLPIIIATTLISTLAFGVYAWFSLYPRFWAHQAAGESSDCARRSYLRRFREPLFRYVRGVGSGFEAAMSKLMGQTEDAKTARVIALLVECCREDLALRVYAESQRFAAK
ncbi:MAG: hypothetical protein AAGD07_18180 [Planctomycetota bacterium]